ncbi:MAG: M23 family metallopeptidase [Bacteroidetes bacterium]|uniref:M23 family metallopeptidase n=1 Tax=Candidatus Cryptobacteroides avistercoris TaxID=2840758 RepID=A0A9D9IYK0_9BACT|nr:M23 family metallopeptidase [Candidatus Cryptobacteroides avistercoris]
MVRQNKPEKPTTYRLSLEDGSAGRSIRSIRFTKAGALGAVAGAVVLLVLLVYCVIAFTPLRTAIPGYPDASSKKTAIENAIKIDSLESAMLRWNLYASSLSSVLSGNEAADFDSLIRQTGKVGYLSPKSEDELRRSDSLLRVTVLNEERFGVSAAAQRALPVEGMHFFSPLKGVLTEGFDRAEHPALDISAPEGTIVSAALDGTVIFAGDGGLRGEVVILQHADNLVSVYSNNSTSLVKTGQSVEAGSPVAIIGSRPGAPDVHYLHFELWHNGNPLDPSEYINY